MIELFCQAMIVSCGAASIWMLNTKHYRRLGAVIGLIAEPFWLWTAIHHRQWGIVLLCFWYSYAYIQGVFVNRKEK